MVIEQYIYCKSAFSKLTEQMFYNVFNLCNTLYSYFTGVNEAPCDGVSNRDAINQQAEKILNQHGNSILRLAYSYLHNMSDAEEILQETLIKFLKVTPCFENQSHEKAWLLRVAGNLSKNKIDYNKIRKTDELNETLVSENREDLSFVWNAVKELPPKYREVIHLFYHEGYSSAQIAKIVNKNESTIRSDLRRGRAKLKEVLKEDYGFEENL